MPRNGTPAQEPDEVEAQLVAAAIAGDREAFSRLYERHVRPVYRYLISRVAEQGEAEDLTSQTFLRALKALPGYRHRGHFAAWLLTIAHHLVADHYRRQRTRGPMDALADHASSPDLTAEPAQVHERRRLAQQVRLLTDEEQELLRLRYAADLTYGEIGRRRHRSAGAVKKSIYRLLDRLQRRMEDAHE